MMGEPLEELISLCLCRLINFMPYLLLALLPFKGQLRCPRRIIPGLAVLLAALDCGTTILSRVTGEKGLATVLDVMLYAIFFRIAVKGDIGKVLFVLFMVLNYAATASISAIFIGNLCWGYAVPLYRSRGAFILGILLAVSLPLMKRYIEKNVQPLIDSNELEIQRAFRTLWMIPAVFYLILYYSFYANWANASSLDEFAVKPGNTAFVLILYAGSFLMYRLARGFLMESQENLRLLRENSQLSLVAKQHESLRDKIDMTLRARHDLRHHITAMEGFLKVDDIAGLKAYLSEYKGSLPDIGGLTLCTNQVVNAVAGYYRDLAVREGIEAEFSFHLAARLPIPESDFCSILGNLLENAWEACLMMGDKTRFIRVDAHMESSHLMFLLVENSYENEIRKKDGQFLSSKRNGSGIGITSVRCLVEKYGGAMKIECGDSVFRVNILFDRLSD